MHITVSGTWLPDPPSGLCILQPGAWPHEEGCLLQCATRALRGCPVQRRIYRCYSVWNCHLPSVQASDRQTLLQACASFKQAHGDMKEAAQAWQQLRRVAASKAVKQQALAGLVACTATWDPGKGQGMCTRCFGSPLYTAVTAITRNAMSASWCVREMDLIAAPPSGCSEVAGAGWLVCWWGRHGAVSCHRSVCENR